MWSYCRSDSSWLVLPSARCAATSHLAPDVTVLVNNDVCDALIDHSDAFPVVAVSPPSPRRLTTLPQPSHNCTSPSHCKAANTQLESGLSHLSPRPYKIPPPSSPQSSSLDYLPSFRRQCLQQGFKQENNCTVQTGRSSTT